jgi:hypothetical protein
MGSGGIQFEQNGDGDCTVIVLGATFDNNSEDGIEVEEDGNGDLSVYLQAVLCERAIDEAFGFSEKGNGSLLVELYGCIAIDHGIPGQNKGDAFKLDEQNDGGMDIKMTDCHVFKATNSHASGDDGCIIRPGGTGDVKINLFDCTFSDCKKRGLRMNPSHWEDSPPLSSTAKCELTFGACMIKNNGDDGIRADSLNPHGAWFIDITDSPGQVHNYTGNGAKNLNDPGTWDLRGIASNPLINN